MILRTHTFIYFYKYYIPLNSLNLFLYHFISRHFIYALHNLYLHLNYLSSEIPCTNSVRQIMCENHSFQIFKYRALRSQLHANSFCRHISTYRWSDKRIIDNKIKLDVRNSFCFKSLHFIYDRDLKLKPIWAYSSVYLYRIRFQ